MQNPILKFRQGSALLEKTDIFPESWKLCRAPTTIEFNNFYWKFAHISLLSMSIKRYSRILFTSRVIC